LDDPKAAGDWVVVQGKGGIAGCAGGTTMAQLAWEFRMNTSQVTDWKEQLLEQAACLRTFRRAGSEGAN
jgi:hypothetical protein